MKHSLFLVACSLLVFANPIKLTAQPSSTLTSITANTAQQKSTKLHLYPGRNTVINFQGKNELIFSIKLGDPSKIIYNTDVPLSSGKAKSLYLTPIEKLKFPGITTTIVTNLIVKTIDKTTGEQQIYLFDLYHTKNASNTPPQVNGVTIITSTQQSNEPKKPSVVTERERLSWRVDKRTATLSDIEQGLRIAILRGWTKPDDPVVAKIKEFVAVAYNTPKITLIEAAQQVKVQSSVIHELAKIGLDFPDAPLLSAPNKSISNSVPVLRNH